MKNTLLGIIAIIILGGIAHQFMPYWGITIVAGIVGLIFSKSASSSFFYGFVGVLLLWGVAAYSLDAPNESILSVRMGELLEGIGSTGVLMVTVLIGGLLGGLGAMTGTLGKKIFE
ncbi:MAG: hypothetical protein AAF573_13745 [Bacteroidota bacterium]